MSQSIEEIALKAVNDTEISALKYCVKLLKKYPVNAVIESLEDYIKELEND